MMQFIERSLGIAPDNGSGSFEMLLFAIPVLVFIVLVRRTLRRSDHDLTDRW
jgi:hypothetical protein